MKKNNDELKKLRHSAAHLAAHALSELHPDVKLTIGPATEDGFFYDVLLPENLKEEDLTALEKRMRDISKRDYPLEQQEISKAEAREIYKDNPFKLELIDQIPGEKVGLAVQGDFKDLCRGGHVASTGTIKHFKLTGLSGSYWRADKKNKQLQRIHGTAFLTKEDLEAYETRQEELKKYDHRRLGKKLDLFSFHPEAVGFPFFHPKGKRIISKLIAFMRKLHREHNYQEVFTPTILNDELWRRSGHYTHYREHMYFTHVDDKTYAIKPMNCPGAFLIYANRPRSYRELPLKLAEFGHVHRHELSGVLHGLFRVRAFTIDDTHIFCTLDQVHEQIKTILEIASYVLKKCDFENIEFALSTRPNNAMGSEEVWKTAINALKKSLDDFNHPYYIEEGEGAFYGPKISIYIKDSIGREWQCGTIQLDFFQPENFDLTYVAPSGTFERPIIIHTAIYGSLERFFGILLEHYKGHLPFWLAPEQVRILTITDAEKPYAREILAQLKQSGIYAELNETSDPISGQIKAAQNAHVALMAIIGKQEVASKTITLRHPDGTQEKAIPVDSFFERLSALNRF